ncbi:MAG TPA: periplasmic heavy metal sensor [Burkholderiales bacterium]|nr:periplasmic heavy metal sensor [Burkholderiales bacterium]
MTQAKFKYALALSVLLNLGVLAAVGYTAARQGGVSRIFRTESSAADYLKLTPQQRQQWHALEAGFLREFQSDVKQIAEHREKLIRGMFSDRPDLEQVEAERVAIARLQAQQQKRVIAQVLQERELLDVSQQQALAELLRQAPGASAVERLHRQ